MTRFLARFLLISGVLLSNYSWGENTFMLFNTKGPHPLFNGATEYRDPSGDLENVTVAAEAGGAEIVVRIAPVSQYRVQIFQTHLERRGFQVGSNCEIKADPMKKGYSFTCRLKTDSPRFWLDFSLFTESVMGRIYHLEQSLYSFKMNAGFLNASSMFYYFERDYKEGLGRPDSQNVAWVSHLVEKLWQRGVNHEEKTVFRFQAAQYLYQRGLCEHRDLAQYLYTLVDSGPHLERARFDLIGIYELRLKELDEEIRQGKPFAGEKYNVIKRKLVDLLVEIKDIARISRLIKPRAAL